MNRCALSYQFLRLVPLEVIEQHGAHEGHIHAVLAYQNTRRNFRSQSLRSIVRCGVFLQVVRICDKWCGLQELRMNATATFGTSKYGNETLSHAGLEENFKYPQRSASCSISAGSTADSLATCSCSPRIPRAFEKSGICVVQRNREPLYFTRPDQA